MKEEIRTHLNDPVYLERLYRTNKAFFKQEFSSIYPEIKGSTLADFWNERLHYESDDIQWGTGRDLLFIVLASLVAGLVAKIPHIFLVNEDFFYPRNVGFIVFPPLLAYFVWKNALPISKIVFIAGTSFIGLIFINFFPANEESDTLILSCIHLLLLLWSVLGFAYVGEMKNNHEKRLNYLKYNGDLIVMTTLILIAGAVTTAMTIGLFSIIGYDIKDFYFENIVVFGLPAVPIVGTYLTQTNPHLVGKVSSVIARIFSPLVLGMLLIYLIAMIFSGGDPYDDREFLLMFNALLIGVMAIIFFSVAETTRNMKSQTEILVLFLLSVVTIIINIIALSAILFRITEWGITPNRAAVLGGNVLILINLLWVTLQLFRVLSKNEDINKVGKAIALYLPLYFLWTIIVTFIFPLAFGFE
ncbi:hypothetical protein WJR50_20010 [Catalinimonas sp. 4WD22]|uniref:hypothetical protein n=1 Tax=Catalinimonas locisalis TaxID=3133978 RepID=UPI003100B30D